MKWAEEQIFLQKSHIHGQPINTWRNGPHHLLSGKYKSKPQWDTTSYQWEWWKLTRQETNVGKDTEKGKPSWAVGGNETGPFSYNIHKDKLKMVGRPKCETRIHQNPRRKYRQQSLWPWPQWHLGRYICKNKVNRQKWTTGTSSR